MKDVVDSHDTFFRTKSRIVAVDELGGESRVYPPQVMARFGQNDREAYTSIARLINADSCDVLNIQHEYGLFGGEDGEWIVDLIEPSTSRSSFRCIPCCPDRPPTICASHGGFARRPARRRPLATGKDILSALRHRSVEGPRHPSRRARCSVPRQRFPKIRSVCRTGKSSRPSV